jgi:hypothetical protein
MIKKFIIQFFGNKNTVIKESKEMPLDWNLTVDELVNEIKNGKRGEMTPAEYNWAREYEMNIMRRIYRFPKRGDLYRAKFEQTISYQVELSGVPTSFFGSIIIKGGEQLWVYCEIYEDEPLSAFLLPVHYKEMESNIITEDERKGKMYNGFYFNITTKILNEKFDLIQTDFIKDKHL